MEGKYARDLLWREQTKERGRWKVYTEDIYNRKTGERERFEVDL